MYIIVNEDNLIYHKEVTSSYKRNQKDEGFYAELLDCKTYTTFEKANNYLLLRNDQFQFTSNWFSRLYRYNPFGEAKVYFLSVEDIPQDIVDNYNKDVELVMDLLNE